MLLGKVKDIRRKSGEGAATGPFFDELDGVLGTRPASDPVELIESSASTSTMDLVTGKLQVVGCSIHANFSELATGTHDHTY